MDDTAKITEIVNQFGLVLHEAQETYGPPWVITALIYCTGKIAAQLEKQRAGAGQDWRDQFEAVYKTEMARV